MLVTADVFAQTVSHSVVLNKDSLRQLTRDKIPPQIETIISSVQTARRTSLGWKIEPNPHVNRNGYQSLYRQEHRGG